MKINTLKTSVFLAAFLSSFSLWAQANSQVCEANGGILANLTAVADAQVTHDEMVLGFSSLSKASTSAQASARANQALSNKLAYFKGLPGVKDMTTSLNTYQDYQSKGWAGQAQVTLILDFAKSASLDIQSEPFGVSSTSTRASEQSLMKAKAPLIQEAVKELNQKGELLAKASGKKVFVLRSMHLQDEAGGPPPMQPMMARTMSADVPELSTGNLTQGKSQVSVQISATGCLN